MFWNKYPYTNFHELNLDWILQKIKEMDKSLSEFEALNKITFSGEWDITKQYPAWTIVNTNGGTEGYISIKPVPAGVTIDNTEYWSSVVNYTATIADLQNRVVQLESDMSDVQDELDRMNTPKVIMLTDSFGENVTPNISTLVPTQMDWPASDYLTIVKGGCGFGPSTPYNYLTQLQAKAADIVSQFGSADAITDIIVTGGTNDSYYGDTASDIKDGISAFVSYVNSTYPNAKITIFFTGWTDSSGSVANLTFANIRVAMGCYQTVVEQGGRYFDLHNILHQHSAFNGDHIHPTVASQYMLADGICAHLNNGEYHVSRDLKVEMTPEAGVTVSGVVRFNFSQRDDVVTAWTDRASNFFVRLNCEAMTAAGDINNHKIGTFTDWIIGNDNAGTAKLNTFAIVGWNGGANCFPVSITFQNGNVYLAIGNANSTNMEYTVNQWRTESVTFDSYNC